MSSSIFLASKKSKSVQSVQTEAWPWGPPSNGARVQPAETVDPAVAILLARLGDDQWVSLSRAGSYRQFFTDMLGQTQAATSAVFVASQPAKPVVAQAVPAPKGSAEALLGLVEKWLAEDDGYDAAAWPVIQQDIEENRLSNRSRFHG